MDAVAKFLCQQGDEQFHQALKLNDEDSQNDPETEPYKCQYKARELWHELKSFIDESRRNDTANAENSESELWKFLAGGLDWQLGRNYHATEELSTGETHLKRCIDALESYRLDERACCILLNAYNEMGVLWTARYDSTKALSFLKKAEELYLDYERNVGGAPCTLSELFTSGENVDDGTAAHDRTAKFESTYTHTLYYLAQVYGRLDESDTSARYCHVTLSRQLKTNTYKPDDWALNAAMLSQFYVKQSDFAMARYCLASALVILTEADNLPKTEDEDAAIFLARTTADVYRCCVKYGIALLEVSCAQLDEDAEPNVENCASGAESKNQDHMFDLEVTSFESSVTGACVAEFEDARKLFLVTQKWVTAAKVYYTMDEHCFDFVELTRDHSNLFKLLARFEHDAERQCKMHKRRVDVLSASLTELNPQYYLLTCRQLMYELAETYSEMMDLKLDIVAQTNAPPTPHAVTKINLLIHQGLEKYNEFMDSLKDSKKEIPQKFPDEVERPALVAQLCSGRLHSKFIESDVGQQVASLRKAVECYRYVVDYCARNPSAEEKVSAELGVCQDMVTLLPAKIAKIELHALQC